MSRTPVLAGLGAVVPPGAVTNEMLASRLDTSDEWILTRTGIRERRIAAPGVATSDLAVSAGERALESARASGIGSIDLVVLATTTPDHPCPATAPAVAHRLGLGTIPAYDVAAVCSGFVYALSCAAGAIAAGLARSVLVIGAETFSSILDPGDRATAAIFGDGAGAVVLRGGDPAEPGALLAFDLGSDGSQVDAIQVYGGGSRQRGSGEPPREGEQYFRMHGRNVFTHAVRRMSASTEAVLANVGWAKNDLDWLVGHQANLRILRTLADHLGIARERAVVHLDRVGNTSAASIPLALADAVERGAFAVGDRMLLTAFGGGLTWGSVALTWPPLSVAATVVPAQRQRAAALEGELR